MTFSRAESQLIVLFGASGDLTSRKLVPALLRLFQCGNICENTRILGVGRSPFTDEGFARKILLENSHLADSERLNLFEAFADRFFYFTLDNDYLDQYDGLATRVGEINTAYKLE